MLTIFAIDGKHCLGTFLGMLWGWCQVHTIVMAFQVRLCRFIHQSVFKIPPDLVCHLVLVCIYVCL